MLIKSQKLTFKDIRARSNKKKYIILYKHLNQNCRVLWKALYKNCQFYDRFLLYTAYSLQKELHIFKCNTGNRKKQKQKKKNKKNRSRAMQFLSVIIMFTFRNSQRRK